MKKEFIQLGDSVRVICGEYRGIEGVIIFEPQSVFESFTIRVSNYGEDFGVGHNLSVGLGEVTKITSILPTTLLSPTRIILALSSRG